MTTKNINGMVYTRAVNRTTPDRAAMIAARHNTHGNEATIIIEGDKHSVYVNTGEFAPVRAVRTHKPRAPKLSDGNPDNSQDTKRYTHTLGVLCAREILDDVGVKYTIVNKRGVDFPLDDGTKVLVRAMSGESRLPLMNGSLNTLKADFLLIITNLNDYAPIGFYGMSMHTAKNECVNNPYIESGRDNYFIDTDIYQQYRFGANSD